MLISTLQIKWALTDITLNDMSSHAGKIYQTITWNNVNSYMNTYWQQ